MFLRTALLAAALVTGAVCLTGQATPARLCGTERWPVKTLADTDRALVDTVPVVATIAELNAIPIPDIPYPNNRRIPPHELRTYRVRGVLAQVIVEDDKDWHLILRDEKDPSLTIIAEVPDPICAATPLDAEGYAAVRTALRKVPRRSVVDLTGVGFFDFIHSQRGRARNGFELHPVVGVWMPLR